MLKILIQNSSSSLVSMFVKLIITFFMTPVIVKSLGNYDYGLWEIVFSLVGYMGLLDVGIRPAVVRYVAKYHAISDIHSLQQLFTTSTVFSSLVGVIGCTILLLWSFLNPEVIANNNTDKYMLFLVIIALQILFQFPGYVAECFHAGFQRYKLLNAVTMVNSIIGSVVVYYLLTHGFGLLTLALGNAIGLIVKYLLYFILLFSESYGSFRLRRSDFSFELLKTIMTFGSKSFVSAITATVGGSTSTLAIGYFCGASIIPFYTIPNRLISYFRDITTTVTNVFMPTFSHLHSADQKEAITEIYNKSTKYLCGLIFPMIIGASVLGKPFLAKWIGTEYAEKGSSILFIISITYLFNLSNPLLGQLVAGINRIGIILKLRIISVIILVVASLLLVRPLGALGAVLALLLTTLITVPFEFKYTSDILKISYLKFFTKVYQPLILPNAVLYGALLITVKLIKPVSYFEIALSAIVVIPFYLVMFWFLSVSADERPHLLSLMKNKNIKIS